MRCITLFGGITQYLVFCSDNFFPSCLKYYYFISHVHMVHVLVSHWKKHWYFIDKVRLFEVRNCSKLPSETILYMYSYLCHKAGMCILYLASY